MSKASESPDIRLQARVAELAASFESAVVEYFDFIKLLGYKFTKTYKIFESKFFGDYPYDIKVAYNNTQLPSLELYVIFRRDPRDGMCVLLGLKTDEKPGPSSVRWIETGGDYYLGLDQCLESRGVKMPGSVRVRFDLLALFSQDRYYTLLKEAMTQKVQQLAFILKSEIEILKQVHNEATRR